MYEKTLVFRFFTDYNKQGYLFWNRRFLSLKDKKAPYRLHIGMRNIKTAISTTLCALIYLIFLPNRNPAFACIGAIFGMGSNNEDSKLNGGNRLFGTIIGGVLGMLLFRAYLYFNPEGTFEFPLLIFLFIGTILLVMTSLFFRWPGAIQPGGVVLCIILFNQNPDVFVRYSLDRIFDTALGVMLSIVINIFFPRETIVNALNRIGIRNDEEIENNEGQTLE